MSASNPPEPSTIVRTAIGYMAARQLFAASRVGLFRALTDGPKTYAELALATGVSERNARILADAMNSLGLLDRAGGRYSLTQESAYYLGSEATLDLAPFLSFLSAISFKRWYDGYDDVVDTGNPGKLELDEAGWGGFMHGVQNFNTLNALMLSDRFDFTPYHRLLDFGGLSPMFALDALRQHAGLEATLIYAPSFADGVRAAVEQAGLAGRARVEAGETESTVPDGSYDLVLTAHVIHRFTPAQNETIFTNLRQAAASGATLLLLDFFLDDEPRQRDLDALHAGEYFVIDGTVVYPYSEVVAWLGRAGWRPGAMIDLPGGPRVLTATAA